MGVKLNLEKFEFKGVDSKRPLVMAGPCSAETEEQVLETARQLASGNPVQGQILSKELEKKGYPGLKKFSRYTECLQQLKWQMPIMFMKR
jgi:hypothetical protein